MTAVFEVRRRPGTHGPLGQIYVRYHSTESGRVEELDFPLPPGILATELSETSDRFRLVAGVAELSELLRHSYWARDGSYAAVLEVLAGCSPELQASPGWRDSVEMTLRAQALSARAIAQTARTRR